MDEAPFGRGRSPLKRVPPPQKSEPSAHIIPLLPPSLRFRTRATPLWTIRPIKFLLDTPTEGTYTKSEEWMFVLGIAHVMGKQSLA